METAKKFGIAGVAGCGATSFCHPLDVVRINLQVDQAGARAYKGTFDCFAVIFRKEGFRGLYAGISAGMLRQITYGMPRMAFVPMLYDTVRSPGETNALMPLWKKLFCGAMGGGAAACIGVPSEVCLVRMSGDQKLAVDDPMRRNYKGVFDAMRRILADEGVAGLWQGAAPTVARAMLLNMGQMPVASQAKPFILDNFGIDGIGNKFLSSIIAAFFAAGFSTPADVIKSTMQNAPKGTATGVIEVTTKLVKAEGPMALYKGFTPAFVKVAPHTVISFMILDYLSRAVFGKDLI
jgi:hypothetical protein